MLVETELSELNKTIEKTKGTVYVLTELYDAKAIIDTIRDHKEGERA